MTVHRLLSLLAAGAIGLAIAMPLPAAAVDTGSPEPTRKPEPKAAPAKSGAKKKAPKKKERKSEQRFIEGYKAAHATIYQRDDFAGGYAKLRALGRDDHPDVANLLGFTSRKLGRYDDAKRWYDVSLAGNPGHKVTWSYYGMWHAERGNVLKARDHLATLERLCGNTTCREYVMLKEVIEGTRTY